MIAKQLRDTQWERVHIGTPWEQLSSVQRLQANSAISWFLTYHRDEIEHELKALADLPAGDPRQFMTWDRTKQQAWLTAHPHMEFM